MIRCSVNDAVLLMPHPMMQICSVEVFSCDCDVWHALTRSNQSKGRTGVSLCLFSTEDCWIKLPLQWILQGHEVFIRWMGICIFARRPLWPWDKTRRVAWGCSRNGLVPPGSSAVPRAPTGSSDKWQPKNDFLIIHHFHNFSCFPHSTWLLWSETLLSSATNQKCAGRCYVQGAWLCGAPLRRGVSSGDVTRASPRWLFPLVTRENAISCQNPSLTIVFNINMNSLVNFSSGYFLLWQRETRPS